MILNQLRSEGVDDDAGEPQQLGRWFPIRFTPDAATGEVLNLGVAFVDSDGRLHTRLLDRFEGVQCLYQGRLSDADIAFLIRNVKKALPNRISHPEQLRAPSPQVRFGDWQPAGGRSVEDLLSSLYTQMVTLGQRAKEKDDEKERPQSIPTKKARQNVFDAMRRRSDLSDQIIADPQEWVVGESDRTGRKRVLDMPLRGRGHFGTLVSAGYITAQTRQVHLYSAVMDLETALQIHPDEFGGVFVLRPSGEQRGYDENVLSSIDNDLDQLEWRLRYHRNVRFEAEENAEMMAERVLEWADAS